MATGSGAGSAGPVGAEAGVPAKVQTRVMESSQHVKVRLVRMRVVRKRVVNLWVRTEIANQQR